MLATLGLVALVYGFTEAAKEDVGWTAPTTLGFLAVSAALLVTFFVVESRVANPLLPLRIVRDRNRGGSYLVFLFVGAGLFAMFLFLTFYLQAVLGYSPLEAGIAFLPFSGGIILGSGVVSQLLPRVGPRPLLLVGLVLASAGMLWLTRLTPESSYAVGVLPALLVMSVGMAAVFLPASSTALAGVGGHDASIATAVLNTSQQVGGSLGVALLNTLYASAVSGYMTDNALEPVETPFGFQPPPVALVEGYSTAFFWGAVLLLALVAATVLVTARREDLPAEAAVVA